MTFRLLCVALLLVALGAGRSIRDQGPPRDVRGVRAVMAQHVHAGPVGPARIGPVHVIGHWAVAWWINDGGGTAFLERRNGAWRMITAGGGLLCPNYLTRYMPLATARRLLGELQVRDCARFGD